MFQAEPDRAGGRYRKPDTPRAEMLQVRLTHPLIDLPGLLSVPQATSSSKVARRKASTRCGGQVSERIRGAGAGPGRHGGVWPAAQQREVAGGDMARAESAQFRLLFGAPVLGIRAARAEPAA
jgi:hypothetical protein